MDDTTGEFLRSVGNAFADNGLGPRGVALLLVLAGAALGLALSVIARGALRRRAALDRFAATHGLGPADVALARDLAARAGAAPLDVLVRVDVFERATALALADVPPGGAADPAARIAHLRQALRFDRLPAHAPLLATRELPPGTAVEADLGGRRRGVVLAADERTLRVELEGEPALAPGAELALAIPHARDVPHRARCRVVAVAPASHGGTHVTLAHDEAPERVQHRAFARVSAEGDVTIQALIWPVTPPTARLRVTARLVDASAGGLHVASPVALPVGLLAELAFGLGDAEFAGLRAVVLACERAPSRRYEARLELRGLAPAERDRLVAAVARAEARGRPGGHGEA